MRLKANSFARLILGLVAFVIGAAGGLSASERFDLSGYWKSYSSVIDYPVIETNWGTVEDWPLEGSLSNRMRLNARCQITSWLTFAAAYSLVGRVQDPTLIQTDTLFTGISENRYRIDDLNERLYPDEINPDGNVALFQNLDRIFLTASAPGFDIMIGRQAIAWGSAHAVNPTDILAPYMFNELDTEDRLGVDAVRMRIPIGFMGEIDAGYVSGENADFDRSAVFLRGKYYAWRTDLSAMLVGFRENLMLGFDLTRAVGGAGFWLESGHVLVDALGEERNGSDADYFRLSTGLDYSFGSKTYGFIEYHYNSAGRNDTDEYPDILTEPAYTEGAVYLLGKHYVIPGVSYQLTPLITAGGQALVNLSDGSALLAPSLEYNIAENIYLAGGAYIGAGKAPDAYVRFFPSSTRLIFNSEFGTYPDQYFVSFRLYF